MCSLCLMTPCHPSCPNAPEPKPVMECAWCHEGIFAGDKYIDSPEGPICEECVDGMTVTEYMELIGEKFSTAEEKEEW